MKRMKKLLAGILAATMVFSMSATVLATEPDGGEVTYADQETITIQKEYSILNEGTTSPAEEFTFKQIGSDVTDSELKEAPPLEEISSVTFTEGEATKEGVKRGITITLPEYDRVGVYEYTLAEVAGTSAGVVYDEDSIKLRVTVIQQGNALIRIPAVYGSSGLKLSEGDAAFTNEYQAGTLNISKEVKGNLGDRQKYFKFTVSLKGDEGKTYAGSYSINGGDYEGNDKTIVVNGGPATVYLKDGDEISIPNLPYGVLYTVAEESYADDKYVTTSEGATGTVEEATQSAEFVNTKEGEIDTGINLDSLPYLIVFAGVLAAAVVVFARRRRTDD